MDQPHFALDTPPRASGPSDDGGRRLSVRPRRSPPASVGRQLAIYAAALAIGAPTLAAAQATGGASATRVVGGRDTLVIPSKDAARAADAEIRIALYELTSDRPVEALSRLRAVVVPPASAGQSASLAGEPGRHFLIAECYYRLGLDDQFHAAADSILAGPAADRFAAVLHAQLLLSAYRTGDLKRAASVMKAMSADQRSALTILVSGLVDYQSGDPAGARVAFAEAQRSAGSGPYADYARYMGVIAAVRGDSAHASAVLLTVEAAIGSATGEGANQLKLAEAQIAYRARQFDRAAASAAMVEPHGDIDEVGTGGAYRRVQWSEWESPG